MHIEFDEYLGRSEGTYPKRLRLAASTPSTDNRSAWPRLSNRPLEVNHALDSSGTTCSADIEPEKTTGIV